VKRARLATACDNSARAPEVSGLARVLRRSTPAG